MVRPLSTVIVLALATLLAPSTCHGDEMENKFDGLAKSLAGLLMQKGMKSVAVGEFTGPAALRSSAGPAIGQALIDALGVHKIKSDEESALEIRGEYFVVEGDAGGSMTLKLKFAVVDTTQGREEIAKPEIDLFDAVTVARLTGATGDLSGKTNREKSRKVLNQIKSPSVKIIRGGRPKSRIEAPGQPYAVEIQVKGNDGYTPRDASDVRGRAVVELERDEVFAVRLINDSPIAAAVELCIDGVNVFSLHRDPELRVARYIIPPRSDILVKGYASSNNEGNEFLVAGLDAPVDGRLLPKGSPKIGTITAMFSASWRKGDAPPEDEPDDDLALGGDDKRVIPGARFDQKIEKVPFEIGRPRAQVAVRYTKGS